MRFAVLKGVLRSNARRQLQDLGGEIVEVSDLSEIAGFTSDTIVILPSSHVTELYRTIEDLSRKLEDAEARLLAIGDLALVGIFVHVGGKLAYANPCMAEMLGYSREDIPSLIGRNVLDFVAPGDRELVASNMQRRIEGEVPPESYAMSMLDRDGSPVPVEIRVQNVRWDGKRGVLGHVVDLRPHLRREHELRRLLEHERFLAQVTAVLLEARTRRNPHVVRQALKLAAEHMGACASRVKGRGPRSGHVLLDTTYLTGEHKRELPDWLDEERFPDIRTALARGEVVAVSHWKELRRRFREGFEEAKKFNLGPFLVAPMVEQKRLVGYFMLERESAGRPWSEPDRNLAAVMAGLLGLLIKDSELDERSRLVQERLFGAQKMETVGELASGLARKIRDYLTVINGNVSVITWELRKDSHLLAALGDIREATDRASQLVTRLLTFAKKQPLSLETVDLNEVVRSHEGLIRNSVGSNMRLDFDLQEGLWPVVADRERLGQCLVNLALNANDAMPKGGTLTIRTRNVEPDEDYIEVHPYARKGPHAVLEVRDTGIGIPQKHLKRVFDPFFTTKGHRGGTGMGLAVVYGIVKQHGGSIEVHSERDKGSAFVLYFPARKEHSGPKDDKIRQRVGKRLSVLVVEGDRAVRSAIHEALRHMGHSVVAVARKTTALKWIKRRGFDVLVCEFDPADRRGTEFVEQATMIQPQMRLILVSDLAKDERLGPAGRVQGAVCLKKPVGFDELERAIGVIRHERGS